MQAEIELSKVYNMSNEKIAADASSLVDQWPDLSANDNRALVETIVRKTIVGEGEIELNLC
jgi:hypothetical protein